MKCPQCKKEFEGEVREGFRCLWCGRVIHAEDIEEFEKLGEEEELLSQIENGTLTFPVVTMQYLPGFEIVKLIGPVYGLTVRSRGFGGRFVAGVEAIFQARVPEGLTVIDVYGEGSKAIIEMEADPVWLVAFLGFIKAHWLAIMIGGLTLIALIAFMRIEVPEEFVGGVGEIAKWGAVALIALVLLSAIPKRKRREGGQNAMFPLKVPSILPLPNISIRP